MTKLKCNAVSIVTFGVPLGISCDLQTLQWNPGKMQTLHHALCLYFIFYETLLISIPLFSDPLFTRQNPFKSSSRLEKTHYHPSRPHSLSKTEKRTVWFDLNGTCFQKTVAHLRYIFYIVIIWQALSPVRFDQPPGSRLTAVNQDSQKLLGTQKSCSGVTDEQPVFPESWPASTAGESSSSRSTASHAVETIAQKAKSGSTAISSERRNWQVCFILQHSD